MLLQSFNLKTFALAAAVLTAGLVQTFEIRPAQARSYGPFTHLAGVWSGNGTIALSDGTHERIRCRVHYAVSDAGTSLSQDLRCASDSYKFDVKSDVHAHGHSLSGSWTETTRGITGNISGTVSGGVIRAIVRGAGFSAGLSLNTRGNSQYVTIQPQAGTDVARVTVRLRKH